MELELVLVFLIAAVSLLDQCLAASADPEKTVEYYTDRCLDGKYHKDKPGPESSLFSQCDPWRERSCCTEEISGDLHIQPMWHNFDWNHCPGRPLSPTCEAWMRQDLCFYECTPNVGPWLVPQKLSIRNERFVGVPLCQSECNVWFEACRHDLTCKDNWAKGWDWSSGSNECPAGSTCETFEAKFGNATNMCERIWNRSYKVVPDTESCMVLWFDPAYGNPNEAVAQARAEELARGAATPTCIATLVLSCIAGMAATVLATWMPL